MFGLINSITALLLATVLLLLANGLLSTLLAVRMSLGAFDPGAIGAIMAAYYLGLLLGSVWGGIVVSRVGHARAFAVFAALVTAATLIHALMVNGWLWGALRLVTGFSMAGLFLVIESWLNERGQGRTRGRLFSMYQIASYFGLGVGQLLLSVSPVEGTGLFILAGTLFALCLVPIAATRTIQPAPLVWTPLQLMPVLRASPIGSSVCFGAGLITGSLLALAPIFVTAHVSIGRVATFMAALILGGMLLQYPIGYLSDRFDRQRLIMIVAAFIVPAAASAWWLAHAPFPNLAAAGAVLGGLVFTLYPLGVAQITDRIGDQSFVTTTSATLLLWGVGSVSGPLLVGQLMAFTEPDALLIAVGGIAALLSLTTLMLRFDPLPPSEQSPFRSMVTTTPVMAGLDPRTEPDDPQLDWIDELGRAHEDTTVGESPPTPRDQRQLGNRGNETCGAPENA